MSTDVLRLPRISQKSMASVVVPSNQRLEKSAVILPSVTNPNNMKQQSKRRRMDGNIKTSPQQNSWDRFPGVSSKVSVSNEAFSNATTECKPRKMTHVERVDKRTKQGGTSSTSSPYTGFAHFPLRSRTVAPSSIDNEIRMKSGHNQLRPLGSSRTTRTDTIGVLNRNNVVTLQQLSRYRSTVLVYLDAGWKNSRKDRFYSTLEDAQVKQWKQKRLLALQHQQDLKESKERQHEQLRHIRRKHEITRSRRLNTQHVKWKYVISGKEGDRKEYGLPSEYYTYYGFHPEQNSAPGGEKKVARSQTAQSQKSLHVSLEKKGELRKRNQQRYEYLFATKRNTHLEMIQKIIRDGLYTLDVSDGEAADEAQDVGQPPHWRSSKGATSNVVVKDIIDDAKKVISKQESEIPSELESNCETDAESTQRGKK